MDNPPILDGKRIHPNVWIMTLGSFLTDVSSEMLNNLIPLFLFNILGVKTAAIGLIDGVAETTASLVKIYSGALSDRLGKRKFLTVFGYAISTIAKPFLYLANSWSWVLGVRFADRFGKGIRTAPRDSLLALSATSNQRGIAFGLHRAGDTAGAFIGIGIATLIIWLTQSTSHILTRLTFHYIILASIIPAILAVFILIFGLREVRVENQSLIPLSLFKNWKILNRRFQIFLLIVILFTLGNSSDSFIILRGQERGLNILQIMAMLMTFNAVYSLSSIPAGWLSDKIGRRKIIISGWGIYGLIYLGLALARTPYLVWTLYGFYGVYYALTEGVAKALVADLVPAEQRGIAYGLFNAAIGITALPASLIAGILWQGIGSWTGYGPAAPFIFGSVMALCACILFLMTCDI